MLGRFGLSGHHHLTPICKLSGGQKARVVFTAIALSQPHIILLDEPTNHLVGGWYHQLIFRTRQLATVWLS